MRLEMSVETERPALPASAGCRPLEVAAVRWPCAQRGRSLTGTAAGLPDPSSPSSLFSFASRYVESQVNEVLRVWGVLS